MVYPQPVWNQLKGLTVEGIVKALRKDGWVQESRLGATIGFIKTSANGAAVRRRVVLHVHSRKTFGPRLLQALLHDIGWSEADLIRLKLIRKPSRKKTAR